MAIEVKQLVIKSTVASNDVAEKKASDPCQALEGTKEDILAECKQLIIEMLCEKRER